MGSLKSDSIVIAAKNCVRKQRSIIDEAVRGTTDADADADANASTMTLFASQNIKSLMIAVNRVALGRRNEYIIAVLSIRSILLLFSRFKIRSSCTCDRPHPRILEMVIYMISVHPWMSAEIGNFLSSCDWRNFVLD